MISQAMQLILGLNLVQLINKTTVLTRQLIF